MRRETRDERPETRDERREARGERREMRDERLETRYESMLCHVIEGARQVLQIRIRLESESASREPRGKTRDFVTTYIKFNSSLLTNIPVRVSMRGAVSLQIERVGALRTCLWLIL